MTAPLPTPWPSSWPVRFPTQLRLPFCRPHRHQFLPPPRPALPPSPPRTKSAGGRPCCLLATSLRLASASCLHHPLHHCPLCPLGQTPDAGTQSPPWRPPPPLLLQLRFLAPAPVLHLLPLAPPPPLPPPLAPPPPPLPPLLFSPPPCPPQLRPWHVLRPLPLRLPLHPHATFALLPMPLGSPPPLPAPPVQPHMQPQLLPLLRTQLSWILPIPVPTPPPRHSKDTHLGE